jgi:uncharacterized RDD family membrane protein YckC
MKDKTKVMYAGFWLRFLAYIIDIAIIAAASAALLRPIFIQLSLPISSATLSLYGIVSLTLFLLYFILMTKLTNGQTLGKMIFGLRVISLEENNISWKTILFREGVCRYFLQAFPLGMLYVVTAFTGKKQGIGDLLCDTFVVKDEVYELIVHYDNEKVSEVENYVVEKNVVENGVAESAVSETTVTAMVDTDIDTPHK